MWCYCNRMCLMVLMIHFALCYLVHMNTVLWMATVRLYWIHLQKSLHSHCCPMRAIDLQQTRSISHCMYYLNRWNCHCYLSLARSYDANVRANGRCRQSADNRYLNWRIPADIRGCVSRSSNSFDPCYIMGCFLLRNQIKWSMKKSFAML